MQLLPDPPGRGGAIAQLGERLVCNQKVAGSIPAGSTPLLQCLPRPCALTGFGRKLNQHEFLRGAPGAHHVLFNNLVSFVFDAKFSSEVI